MYCPLSITFVEISIISLLRLIFCALFDPFYMISRVAKWHFWGEPCNVSDTRFYQLFELRNVCRFQIRRVPLWHP